jgi:hypothetical protein
MWIIPLVSVSHTSGLSESLACCEWVTPGCRSYHCCCALCEVRAQEDGKFEHPACVGNGQLHHRPTRVRHYQKLKFQWEIKSIKERFCQMIKYLHRMFQRISYLNQSIISLFTKWFSIFCTKNDCVQACLKQKQNKDLVATNISRNSLV